jgi:uncharacterized protein involved in response to NO
MQALLIFFLFCAAIFFALAFSLFFLIYGTPLLDKERGRY